MESYTIYDEHARRRWELSELPWHEIKRENANERDLALVRGVAFGESNAIAALHLFLNESVDDYDFSMYASIWCAEEVRHHIGFRRWLEEVGDSLPPQKVEAMRAAYPNGISPSATIATNLISELSLTTIYSTFAEDVQCPVLAALFERVGRDEARHAADFRLFLKKRLERHPEELQSVLETFYVYTSDPLRPIKHPVDVFKSKLPETQTSEMPDDSFRRFAEIDRDGVLLSGLRKRLMSTFSALTKITMITPGQVRRAIASVMSSDISPASA